MQIKQNNSQIHKNPLVSFIITYYELPIKMLCECIDSILALSLRPYEREIIVVDDGSENNPLNGLEQYKDTIIYIRQRNKGLSEARNTGIQIAKGEYIQFIDGDDRLIQAPYEHATDIARFNCTDMVMFDFTRTATTDRMYTDSEIQSGSDYMRNNNIRGTACGYLFRRAILGDLRFTPDIYHEDEEFTPLLMIRAESLCVTNAKAYLYRERQGSIITSSNIRRKLKRLNDAKEVIVRLNKTADRLPLESRTALQRRVAQLTMDYIYNIIRQLQSRHYLDRKIAELTKQGLFPLPDKDYTTKYAMFRKLTNHPRGLSLLMRIIPLTQKER